MHKQCVNVTYNKIVMIDNNIIFNPQVELFALQQSNATLNDKLNCLQQIKLTLTLISDDIKRLERANILIEKFETLIQPSLQNLKKYYSYVDGLLTPTKAKVLSTSLDDITKISRKETILNKKKFDSLSTFISNESKRISTIISTTLQEIEAIDNKLKQFFVPDGSFVVSDTKHDFIKLPSPNRCCVNISHIKENIWYAWPDDIEQMSNGHKFKSKDSGIGAGEHWLSFIFGGELQGQNSTFDISLYNQETGEFEKWEVKEFDPKTFVVRLGSHGTDAALDISLEISEIVTQLKNFVDTYDVLQFNGPTAEQQEIFDWLDRYVNSVKKYIDINYSKLVIKGDIANSDIRDLMPPCIGAANILKQINDRCNNKPSIINFCDRKLKLTFEQYTKFLLIVPDILTFDEKLIALASVFKHNVLRGQQNYTEFLSAWLDKLKPSKAFGNVDGIFLTHRHGFIKITKNLVDNVFDYYRLGQGRRPNFKIKNISLPTKLIQINFFGHAHFNDFTETFKQPVLLSGTMDEFGKMFTINTDFSNDIWKSVDVNFYSNTQNNKLNIIDISHGQTKS